MRFGPHAGSGPFESGTGSVVRGLPGILQHHVLDVGLQTALVDPVEVVALILEPDLLGRPYSPTRVQ